MKRVLSRVLTVAVVSSIASMALVGTAWAPRSWVLPVMNVSCQTDEGKAEEFLGAVDLNRVALVKGVVTVGGTVAGSCGPLSINASFRTPISVQNASCDRAELVLADTTINSTTIRFSEEFIPVGADAVGRGPLCKLANSTKASLKSQVNAFDKIVSLLA